MNSSLVDRRKDEVVFMIFLPFFLSTSVLGKKNARGLRLIGQDQYYNDLITKQIFISLRKKEQQSQKSQKILQVSINHLLKAMCPYK